MKMTKEEFRKRMNSQQWMQGKSTEDLLLEACTLIQLELHEADGNVIMNMPSYQFDKICEALGKKYKPVEKNSMTAKGVFG
jgi:hypothetical protein